jgi:hypothetical protein
MDLGLAVRFLKAFTCLHYDDPLQQVESFLARTQLVGQHGPLYPYRGKWYRMTSIISTSVGLGSRYDAMVAYFKKYPDKDKFESDCTFPGTNYI